MEDRVSKKMMEIFKTTGMSEMVRICTHSRSALTPVQEAINAILQGTPQASELMSKLIGTNDVMGRLVLTLILLC